MPVELVPDLILAPPSIPICLVDAYHLCRPPMILVADANGEWAIPY